MKYAKPSNAGTKGYPSTYVLDSFPIFIITRNEIAQYDMRGVASVVHLITWKDSVPIIFA